MGPFHRQVPREGRLSRPKSFGHLLVPLLAVAWIHCLCMVTSFCSSYKKPWKCNGNTPGRLEEEEGAGDGFRRGIFERKDAPDAPWSGLSLPDGTVNPVTSSERSLGGATGVGSARGTVIGAVDVRPADKARSCVVFHAIAAADSTSFRRASNSALRFRSCASMSSNAWGTDVSSWVEPKGSITVPSKG